MLRLEATLIKAIVQMKAEKTARVLVNRMLTTGSWLEGFDISRWWQAGLVSTDGVVGWLKGPSWAWLLIDERRLLFGLNKL